MSSALMLACGLTTIAAIWCALRVYDAVQAHRRLAAEHRESVRRARERSAARHASEQKIRAAFLDEETAILQLPDDDPHAFFDLLDWEAEMRDHAAREGLI